MTGSWTAFIIPTAGAAALFLAADTVSTMAGLEVVSSAEGEALGAVEVPEEEDPRATPRKRSPRTFYAPPEFDHNPFCPDCNPEPEVDPDDPGSSLPESDLPWTLVATMLSATESPSLAVIQESEEGRAGAFLEGELVFGGPVLLAVQRDRVLLQDEDEVAYLELREETPRKKSKKKGEKKKNDRAGKRKHEIEGAAEAISCSGNSCTVKREFVQKLMANPSLMMKQGRARPFSRDGLKGFRLSLVRRGTIPQLLGMRSGDVITSINGQTLESMDGAMAMYARLKNANHLSVEYTRNVGGTRQAKTLDVNIE